MSARSITITAKNAGKIIATCDALLAKSELASSTGYLPLLAHQGNNSRGSEQTFPLVLDACCGPRNMWFNKRDTRAIFVDRRREKHELNYESGDKTIIVDPDILADFTNLPFPDETFALVVMDPPHCRRLEALGCITKKYGVLVPGWEDMLRDGFRECFRVLRKEGVMIFKWCSREVPLDRVLALTREKPLFGHNTGNHAKTHWVCFIKGAVAPAPEEADNKKLSGGESLHADYERKN